MARAANAFPRLKDITEITSLTNVAQAVVAVASGAEVGSSGTRFTHVILSGGAAIEEVIFRAIDDSPEYFRVSLQIGESRVIPGFQVDMEQGLEVITTDAAGDVTVAFFEDTGN